MRYDVLRRYQDVVGDRWLPHGTPLDIRLYPEDTDVRTFFTALITAAYALAHRGSSMIPLNEHEISHCILYDSRRSLLDLLLGRDNRTPNGIYAPSIRGIPTHLILAQSSPDAYDMQTHNFIREVDTIERLIAFARIHIDP